MFVAAVPSIKDDKERVKFIITNLISDFTKKYPELKLDIIVSHNDLPNGIRVYDVEVNVLM